MTLAIRAILIASTLIVLPSCTVRDIVLGGSDNGLTKWHGDNPVPAKNRHK